MNRRGFLTALIGGATLDPERLLWRPAAKLISIPNWRPILGGRFDPYSDLSRFFEAAWRQVREQARRDLQFISGVQWPDEPSVAVWGRTLARMDGPRIADASATSPRHRRRPNPPIQ